MRIMLSFMLVSTYVPASMLLLDLMCCFVASGFAVGVLLACAAVGLLLLLLLVCCCCWFAAAAAACQPFVHRPSLK